MAGLPDALPGPDHFLRHITPKDSSVSDSYPRQAPSCHASCSPLPLSGLVLPPNPHLTFSDLLTFAHLQHHRPPCLSQLRGNLPVSELVPRAGQGLPPLAHSPQQTLDTPFLPPSRLCTVSPFPFSTFHPWYFFFKETRPICPEENYLDLHAAVTCALRLPSAL